MEDVLDTTPPIEIDSQEGSNIPSKDLNTDGENEFKINEIIEKQMEAFKDTFMAQFNKEYSEKLSKFKSDNLELEEKKQRLAVGEELRIAGLDGDWMDFVYDKDFEISKMKITRLEGLIKSEVDKGVLERFKEANYIPPPSSKEINIRSTNKPKYFL